MPAPPNRSPIHAIAETPSRVATVSLRDLSTRPKLGVKGPGAATWLKQQGIELPTETYDTRSLKDGGLIARLGSADFFLEGAGEEEVSRLSAELSRGPAQVYRVERQDAGFLLAGGRSLDVLAQLCSMDFRTALPRRLILTRAGGINCAILLDPMGEEPAFRLWLDYTFGVSFWESLVQIAEDLTTETQRHREDNNGTLIRANLR